MTPAELREQAADLVQALDDEQIVRLVAYAYRLLHEGHPASPAQGLESLLEDRA